MPTECDEAAECVCRVYRDKLRGYLPEGATTDGKREAEFTEHGISVRFHLYGCLGSESVAYGYGDSWDEALTKALDDLEERLTKARRVLAEA